MDFNKRGAVFSNKCVGFGWLQGQPQIFTNEQHADQTDPRILPAVWQGRNILIGVLVADGVWQRPEASLLHTCKTIVALIISATLCHQQTDRAELSTANICSQLIVRTIKLNYGWYSRRHPPAVVAIACQPAQRMQRVQYLVCRQTQYFWDIKIRYKGRFPRVMGDTRVSLAAIITMAF